MKRWNKKWLNKILIEVLYYLKINITPHKLEKIYEFLVYKAAELKRHKKKISFYLLNLIIFYIHKKIKRNY